MGVASPDSEKPAPAAEPRRREMFASPILVAAAALDNGGRITALDNAKGSGEPGWASAQNQDSRVLLTRHH
jgi:hypothetical protein